MKKKTPEQELKELCKDILREIERWEDINQNGCNMNLTRNHIIYDKQRIAQICEEKDVRIPEEMYLPTPPEVSNYYMANMKQKCRIERIGHPEKTTTRRNQYHREQLSLF